MNFKKSNVLKVTLILGVLATLTIFLPALSFQEQAYSGIEIAFGKSLIGSDSYTLLSFDFNILAVLMFLLPIIAGFISLFKPELSLLSAVLFVVSGILMVIIKDYVDYQLLSGISIEVEWNLAIGLILGIILNGLGAVTALLISFD